VGDVELDTRETVTGGLSVPTRLSAVTVSAEADTPRGIVHRLVVPGSIMVIHALSVRSRTAHCHGVVARP
jgi:hypothetical protein